jgi:hypothetical protein
VCAAQPFLALRAKEPENPAKSSFVICHPMQRDTVQRNFSQANLKIQ